MKICFFNLQAYSLFNPASKALIGGTEVQLYYLAKFLAKENEVSFVTGDWGQDKVEVFERVRIYKSISLAKNILNYIKAPFVIWSVLKKVNADVCIASSAGTEIGIIALFCKFNNKKFIYRTAHDWDCTGEFIEKHGIFGRLFQYGLTRASAVVAQNNDHASKLSKNYKISATVIKNALEVLGSDKKEKHHILWVARCAKWKNPNILLKIAKQFPNYPLVMICPGLDDKFFKKIRDEALSLENVRFIKKVSFSEIQKYYNEAKLFIGTSEYEGFPNTYLQACLGSTPIVSYKVNPDNFITENNLGYCADGDFIKMIEQIKKILLDNNDWEEKSKNAFRYVKENHDIDVIGELWKDLIYKLLKK